MYRVAFLPIARGDMAEIVRYVSHELCNPMAAVALADEMIAAAENLTDFPYANAIHQTVRPLKNEYRKLIVKNYILLYWIDEKAKRITIARVMYARRDYEKLM